MILVNVTCQTMMTTRSQSLIIFAWLHDQSCIEEQCSLTHCIPNSQVDHRRERDNAFVSTKSWVILASPTLGHSSIGWATLCRLLLKSPRLCTVAHYHLVEVEKLREFACQGSSGNPLFTGRRVQTWPADSRTWARLSRSLCPASWKAPHPCPALDLGVIVKRLNCRKVTTFTLRLCGTHDQNSIPHFLGCTLHISHILQSQPSCQKLKGKYVQY